MKRILVIRHCKSDWDVLGISDHDRPLNQRGIEDIPKIAARLNKLNPPLQKVYHSTAVRATDTARSIFELFQTKIPLQPEEELYTFSSLELLTFIKELPQSESEVCIVSHNPGLTDLICSLTHIRLDNLPTGGFCMMKFDLKYWSKIGEGTGIVEYLEYPKMIKT